MMNYLILKEYFLLLLFVLSGFSLTAQEVISGKIVGSKGDPLIGAIVSYENAEESVISDENGFFNLPSLRNSEYFFVSYVGYSDIRVKIEGNGLYLISMCESIELDEVAVVAFDPGPNNFWYGAEARYNFVGNNDFSNFLGSAPFKINTKTFNDQDWLTINTVGNIAQIEDKLLADTIKTANTLVNSNQGVSIGLAPVLLIKEFEIDDAPANLRLNFGGVFRYNTFALDSSKVSELGVENISFPQFNWGVGLEFEGIELIDGRPMTFFLNFYSSNFSAEKFLKIREIESGSLTGFSSGIIFPVLQTIGFKASFTTSNHYSNFWSISLLFK